MKSVIALSLLLLSAPLAASDSVTAVPAQFLGNWGGSPGCEPGSDDLTLRIDRKQIAYYESNGPLKAIVVHQRNEIAMVSELSGEGETWLAIAKFKLSPDGSKLIDSTTVPGEETVRYRCTSKSK